MSAHILVQGQRKEAMTFGTYDSVATDRSRPSQRCPIGLHVGRYIRTIRRPKSEKYFCLPFLLFGYSMFPITVEGKFGAKPRLIVQGDAGLHRWKPRRSSERRSRRIICCHALHFYHFCRSV
jgi:hypothetical protein